LADAGTFAVPLALAACATLVSSREPRARALGWIGYVFAAAVIAAYLPYVYFRPEEWSYTRFLLPALPLMLVFVAGVVLTAARRWLPALPLGATVLLIFGIAAVVAPSRVLAERVPLVGRGAQVSSVGRFVRDQLPGSAFVLAAQHSGSVRYYSHRPTLRWDLLDGRSLDRAVRSLRVAGYEPFLVVDTGEDEEFRQRFSESGQRAVAALAPVATIGNTTVYAFK
jgi:hypothetical protein